MFICGSNNCGQLGERSNSQSTWGDGIICPPSKSHLNINSILSFSLYFDHSIIIDKNWRAYAIGNNKEGQISPTLSKDVFYKETEIQLKDENGQPFKFISAVTGENYTLYQVQVDAELTNPRLIYISKNRNPLFVSINGLTPISLFGGHTMSSSITEDGSLLIITERILLTSNGQALVKTLPTGEIPIQVACCEGFVAVLSKSGRVFMSPIANRGETVEFVEVKELAGKQFVSISGKYQHCVAVSKDGRVFGRGSNSNNRLGMTKSEYSKFTEIKSLSKKYKIVEAEAGFGHSLFITSDKKILVCGSNFYGHLMLKKASKSAGSHPVEAIPLCSDPFCIAGYCVSAVMNACDVPPNTPNLKMGRQKLLHGDANELDRSKSGDVKDSKSESVEIVLPGDKKEKLEAKSDDVSDSKKFELRDKRSRKSDIRHNKRLSHKFRRKSTKSVEIKDVKPFESPLKSADVQENIIEKSPSKSADVQENIIEKSPLKSADVQENIIEKSPSKSADVQENIIEKSASKSGEFQENKIEDSDSKSDDFEFQEDNIEKSPSKSAEIQENQIEHSSSNSSESQENKAERSLIKIIDNDEQVVTIDNIPTMSSDNQEDSDEENSIKSAEIKESTVDQSPPKSKDADILLSEDSSTRTDENQGNEAFKSPTKITESSIENQENKPSEIDTRNNKQKLRLSKSDTKIVNVSSPNSPKSGTKNINENDNNFYLAELAELRQKLAQKEAQVRHLLRDKENYLQREEDYQNRIHELENSLETTKTETKSNDDDENEKEIQKQSPKPKENKDKDKDKSPSKKNRTSPLELFNNKSFQKVRQIGYSQASEVYEVCSDDHYVQKILHCYKKFNKSNVKLFIQQCETLIGLNCPNVAKIYAIQTSTFPPSILNELCSSNLKQKIKVLSPDDRVRIIIGVCNGMREIHRAGIIHGSLKLENILLDDENNPKVSDFGFLTFMEKEIDKKTMVFMAPELILEKEDYDEKIDVYAFGVVVYAILNDGICPKIKEEDVAKGKKASIPLSINRFARNLINKCWSFYPSDRPTFDEIYEMLEENEENII